MITAQIEQYDKCIDEMTGLYDEHWKALAPHQDKVPLDPDYEAYLELDRANMLLLATLREDGDLVGYFLGLVTTGLHYQTCLTLTMDIFWLTPASRDKELGAVKLFRAVETEARRRGVQRVVYASKVSNDASRLFEFLKCTKIETHYSKWIGD